LFVTKSFDLKIDSGVLHSCSRSSVKSIELSCDWPVVFRPRPDHIPDYTVKYEQSRPMICPLPVSGWTSSDSKCKSDVKVGRSRTVFKTRLHQSRGIGFLVIAVEPIAATLPTQNTSMLRGNLKRTTLHVTPPMHRSQLSQVSNQDFCFSR
jgi:hypothetical protein